MGRLFFFTWLAVCLGVGSGSCLASVNSIFLSHADIENIHNLIFKEKHPLYLGQYHAMIAHADKLLSAKPPTITENEGPENKNLFFTESPYCGWFTFWGLYGDYCRDGQINPDANREDYAMARRMGVESVVLALAYRLSGEKQYWQKLRELFDTWMVNDETRMAPQYTNGQSQIEISVSHIAIFYALSLVREELVQQPRLYKGVHSWLLGWSNSVDSWQADNNFEDWRLSMRLAIFAMLNNQEQVASTIEALKRRIAGAISIQGEMRHEIARTKSLSYSLYAMKAMLFSAEIAYHHGFDLYQYKDARGVSLERALLLHADFLLADRQTLWPHKQIEPIKKHEIAIFELANKRYANDKFAQVLLEWQRPFTEIRALQYISLTHGVPDLLKSRATTVESKVEQK